MKGIPRGGPSSVFDAVRPSDWRQDIVPQDSIRHLEPHSTLKGKLRIMRGVGHGLLEEARGGLKQGAVSALALGVCVAIDLLGADKNDREIR